MLYEWDSHTPSVQVSQNTSSLLAVSFILIFYLLFFKKKILCNSNFFLSVNEYQTWWSLPSLKITLAAKTWYKCLCTKWFLHFQELCTAENTDSAATFCRIQPTSIHQSAAKKQHCEHLLAQEWKILDLDILVCTNASVLFQYKWSKQ